MLNMIKAKINKKHNRGDFLLFYGHGHTNPDTGFLSQWYSCEFKELNNADSPLFNSAEQYMMYQKAMLFNDINTAKSILKTDRQHAIKSLGRKVANFDQETWDENKYNIAYNGNYSKFYANHALLVKLIGSPKDTIHFVEASPTDSIWGIGISARDNLLWYKYETGQWGQNILGRVLSEVRNDLIRDMDLIIN
jgi:ribA/ribD-fused uncharacterized protein